MIEMRAMVLVCLSSGVVLACGGEGGAAPGYVVLDRQARDTGYGVLLGDRVESGVMPIAVESGQPASLVGPEVERELSLEPGMVAVVRGSGGTELRGRLGTELDPDVVIVRGTLPAASELAAAVGGRAEADGSVFVVRALDAWGAAAGVTAPSGLDEALPAELSAESIGASSAGQPATADIALAGASMALAGARPSNELLARANLGALAAGRPLRCDGVVGTWVGKSYWRSTGLWYEFTLDIEQKDGDSRRLSGEIEANAWRTSPYEPRPPASCSPDGTHFRVRMRAEGELSPDGTLRFEGIDWRPTEEICGAGPRTAGEYCEDHFSGRITRGGLLRMTNEDGCNESLAVVFSRVECGA